MQIHGGDIYNNKVELDFSANINPFGMPESIEAAAIEGIRKSIHYPDIACSELRAAIAKKESVSKEQIICGNGAAEVIFSLIYAYKPKKALLVYPTFLEYEQALKAGGCHIQSYMLRKEDNFELTEAILDTLEDSLDLMFLCNPNNPTGAVISKSLLTSIIHKCHELGILLVIDECFQDFLMEQDQDSRKGSLEQYPNLFILKAFTKMYGMAGLRLGYGLSANQKLLEGMKLVTQPWNVSIPAQKAGIAACGEEAFARKSRAYVAKQREYLKEKLKSLDFDVYDSKANFIFFEGPKGLYEVCLQHKVLIRSCSNYIGLGDTYYRIAVKSQEENEKLVEVLQQIRKNL